MLFNIPTRHLLLTRKYIVKVQSDNLVFTILEIYFLDKLKSLQIIQ